MHFKSMLLSALAATITVLAQDMSAADMVSNIDRLSTLTRVASDITHYTVQVNNNPLERQGVIGSVNSIATQGAIDRHAMTGQSTCGLSKRNTGSIAGRAMLDKRAVSIYTAEEQGDIMKAYATLVAVSQELMAACVDKHYAIVQHKAAHQVAQALKSTLDVLDMMTDTMKKAVPAQMEAMTTQQRILDQSYAKIINMYATGAS